MFQLREDLVFNRPKGTQSLQVREPASGHVFEFGVEEAFLIEAMRAPYDANALMASFRERFGRSEGTEDLEEFLQILGEWNLLSDDAGPQAGLPGSRDQRRPRATSSRPGGGKAAPARADVAARDPDSDQEDASGAELSIRNRWHLFRPEGFLDGLARVLRPLRGLLWLVPFLVFYALGAVWLNRDLVGDAIATARLQFGILGRLIFVGLTLNLAIQVMRGVVARYYRLPVPSFGILLALGLIPRFNIHIALTPQIDRRQRVWLHATSLLVRLVTFGLGITLWLATRPTGSLLSTVGAELAFISAITFLMVANPLWPADGYNLIANLSGKPNLRQRAKSALKGLFLGRPRVVARYLKDSPALALFGAASILFPVLLIAVIATVLAHRLESAYRGAGVALFLFLGTYVVYNFLRQRAGRPSPAERMRRGTGARPGVPGAAAPALTHSGGGGIMGRDIPESGHRPAHGGRGIGTHGRLARAQPRPVRDGPRLAQAPRRSGARWSGVVRRIRRYLLFAALIACLFLPYRYQVGGDAQIFPIASHDIYADNEGVVEQVLFQGGEWVERDTVIAVMANHREQKDVLATEAEIEAKRRQIDRLRTTPSQESIRLAEKQLDLANLELDYSVNEMERLTKLFKQGTVSAQEYDDAKKQRDVAFEKLAEAQASLDALRAQINPNEIAAAEAELVKLEQELAFYREQLRRTFLRMPIAGRIVTLQLQDLRSKYLNEGELFAAVEDAREVRVEIAVPETDIPDVEVGDKVTLKTWMDPHNAYVGEVTEVAPEATAQTFGAVVKVIAVLPNPGGTLKTGMTGYAKIEAGETLVIIAFTKALVRFVLIEIWSWLP